MDDGTSSFCDTASLVSSTSTIATASLDIPTSTSTSLINYLPIGDSKYKSYTSQIDKALKNFEYTQEWHDLISALTKLNKVITSWTHKYGDVPRLSLVAKRLTQCLHPNLPSGVHGKTLETYALIINALPPEKVRSNFFLFAQGLYPLYTYASLQTRPPLLRLLRSASVLATISSPPYLEGLLIALFSTEDDSTLAEEHELLSLLPGESLAPTLWGVMASTPSTRLKAVNYILSSPPDLPSAPPDLLFSLETLISMLQDPSSDILTQRSVLELLLKSYPVNSLSSFKPDLIAASLHSLLRKDMSLNRRLFSWLLADHQESFASSTKPALITGVKKLLQTSKDTEDSHPVHLDKPSVVRILVTLLDKQEFDLISDLIFSVFDYLLSSPDCGHVAALFFANLQPAFVFERLTEHCLTLCDLSLLGNLISFSIPSLEYEKHLPSVLIQVLKAYDPKFQEEVDLILAHLNFRVEVEVFHEFISVLTSYVEESYEIIPFDDVALKERDFWSDLKLNAGKTDAVVSAKSLKFSKKYHNLLSIFNELVTPENLTQEVVRLLVRVSFHGDVPTIQAVISLSSQCEWILKRTSFVPVAVDVLWRREEFQVLTQLFALTPHRVEKLLMDKLTDGCAGYAKLVRFLHALKTFERAELLVFKLMENLDTAKQPLLRKQAEDFFAGVTDVLMESVILKNLQDAANAVTSVNNNNAEDGEDGESAEEKRANSMSDLRHIQGSEPALFPLTKHKSTSELSDICSGSSAVIIGPAPAPQDVLKELHLKIIPAPQFFSISSCGSAGGGGGSSGSSMMETSKTQYVLGKLERLLSLRPSRHVILTSYLPSTLETLLRMVTTLEDPLAASEEQVADRLHLHFKCLAVITKLLREVVTSNDNAEDVVERRRHVIDVLRRTRCVKILLHLLYFAVAAEAEDEEEEWVVYESNFSFGDNNYAHLGAVNVIGALIELLPLEISPIASPSTAVSPNQPSATSTSSSTSLTTSPGQVLQFTRDPLLLRSLRLSLSTSPTSNSSRQVHLAWTSLLVSMTSPSSLSTVQMGSELICSILVSLNKTSPSPTLSNTSYLTSLLDYLTSIVERHVPIGTTAKPTSNEKPSQSLYGIFLSSLLPSTSQNTSDDDTDTASKRHGFNTDTLVRTLLSVSTEISASSTASPLSTHVTNLTTLLLRRNLPVFLTSCSRVTSPSTAASLAKLTLNKIPIDVLATTSLPVLNDSLLTFLKESSLQSGTVITLTALQQLLTSGNVGNLNPITLLEVVNLTLDSALSSNSLVTGDKTLKEVQDSVLKVLERTTSLLISDASQATLFSSFAVVFGPTVDRVWHEDSKDRDKVVQTHLTNFFSVLATNLNQIINPAYYESTLTLLESISPHAHLRRLWKKEVFDLLLSDEFKVLKGTLPKWKTVVDNLFTLDKSSFPELITRVSVPASLNVFGGQATPELQRAMLLKRLALVIYSSDVDQYAKFITNIQERLAEALKSTSTGGSADLHCAVFLVFRVLLLRFSPTNLPALWPIITHELVQVLPAIERTLTSLALHASDDTSSLSSSTTLGSTTPTTSADPIVPPSLYLSTLRLLDELFALPPSALPTFQMYKWAFKDNFSTFANLLNSSPSDDDVTATPSSLDSLSTYSQVSGWFAHVANTGETPSTLSDVTDAIDRDFTYLPPP